MECIIEGIALAVDLLILGLCCKEYVNHMSILNPLKNALQLSLESNLKKIVAKGTDKKVPYAVIRGTVVPIGAPLKSDLSCAESLTSVLQIIKLSEHHLARRFALFWSEQWKLINVSSNQVPFVITNGMERVEIVNGLSASIIDLDLVYDSYEPASFTVFDRIIGFLSGVRLKGFQTTEQVLRDGSLITAIGEVELDGDTLRMRSSSVGPMFLTTATKATLIEKLEQAKSSTLVKICVYGTISVILISIIARKLKKKEEQTGRRRFQDFDCRERRSYVPERPVSQRTRVATPPRSEERKYVRLEDALEMVRQSHPKTLSDEQLCVVCVTNPKEVILLPCGHVCLCRGCSEKIKLHCPVCRSKINSRETAFIS